MPLPVAATPIAAPAPIWGGTAHAALAGAISGALLGVSTLPFELGLLAPLGLVPLLATVVRGASLREGALAGFLCGLGFFGIGLGWGPFVGGGTWQCWVLYAGYVLLASLLGAAFGAALSTVRRVSAGAALAAAPALWLALEECERFFLDSHASWLRLGYTLAPWPSLIQLAALGGVGLVSVWAVSVSAGLVAARRLAPAQRALLAVALLAPPCIGAWSARTPASADRVRVAAVQPAIGNAERFVRTRFDAHLRQILALGQSALPDGAALVVWPESAYELPLSATGFDPFIGALVRDLGVPLVTGARRFTLAEGMPGVRNAALVVDADGALRGIVDKLRPVPFFEAAPRGWASRMLARVGLWAGRFEPGEASSVLQLGGGAQLAALPIGVLVCFDVTDPTIARALRQQGARLLVNPSNEAFSGGWTAVAQARIARLRAAENGVPLVRAANTGPTEWIDAHGALVRSLAAGEAASGSAEVALAGGLTPYTRLGDAPAALVALLPLLFALRRHAQASISNTVDGAVKATAQATAEVPWRKHP